MCIIICTGRRTSTGCLIFTGHFLQKSPVISVSFAKNDVQIKASNGSSPSCIDDPYISVYMYIIYTHMCAQTLSFQFHDLSALGVLITGRLHGAAYVTNSNIYMSRSPTSICHELSALSVRFEVWAIARCCLMIYIYV